MDVTATTTALPANAAATANSAGKATTKGSPADLFELLFASFQGQLAPNKASLLANATDAVKTTDVKQTTAVDAKNPAEGDDAVTKLKAWLTQNWPKDEAKPSDAELSAMAIMVMSQPNWLQQVPNFGEVQADLQQVGATNAGLENLPQHAKGLEAALANLPTAKANLMPTTAAIVAAAKQKIADKTIAVTDQVDLVPVKEAAVPMPSHATVQAATDKTIQPQKLAGADKVANKADNSVEHFFGVVAANQNGQTTTGGQQGNTNSDNGNSELLNAVKSAFNTTKTPDDQPNGFVSHLPTDAAGLGFMAPTAERTFDPSTRLTLTQATNADLYSQMPKLQDPNPASMTMGVYLQRSALTGQNQSFKIRMQPEELGAVQVDIKFVNGKMRARITAEKEDTLEILKSDSQTLTDALRQAGVGADANSLSFSLNEGQQQNAQGQTNKKGNKFAEAFNADAELSAPVQLLAMPRILAAGRVDKAI